ncbi:hypothetical protein TSUD_68270 [Trifolium subterraneum]|uniref:Uncharacterized protein n=1 Tax=Trifolium subterraneum TaxID=3900 RepID=A0A2Z6MHM8_TRISU|nr:hypothetical protein TSUD_68270 [Trifolium subterraneum]
MRREEKKSKNHVASFFEGALELSLNGELSPGDKPPKIGAEVAGDDMFGLAIGNDVVGVFCPPAPLKTL